MGQEHSFIIGIDEVGRAARKKRASLAQRCVVGIDEVGRAARKRASRARQYVIGIDEVGRAAARGRRASPNYIIGIDEVGRGCLAGSVTVAALAMPQSLIKLELNSRKFANGNSSLIRELPLRDSKRLTRRQREEWFQYVKKHPKIFYATADVRAKTIDRINITQAANRAATAALRRLITNLPAQAGDRRLTAKNFKVFLDGGLHLNQTVIRVDRRCHPRLSVSTVIRGDEKIPAVTLASIVAKVTRDRRMRLRDKKYPGYAFLRNVGYGTREHREALVVHGPTRLHRLTFIKKYAKVTNDSQLTTYDSRKELSLVVGREL